MAGQKRADGDDGRDAFLPQIVDEIDAVQDVCRRDPVVAVDIQVGRRSGLSGGVRQFAGLPRVDVVDHRQHVGRHHQMIAVDVETVHGVLPRCAVQQLPRFQRFEPQTAAKASSRPTAAWGRPPGAARCRCGLSGVPVANEGRSGSHARVLEGFQIRTGASCPSTAPACRDIPRADKAGAAHPVSIIQPRGAVHRLEIWQPFRLWHQTGCLRVCVTFIEARFFGVARPTGWPCVRRTRPTTRPCHGRGYGSTSACRHFTRSVA